MIIDKNYCMSSFFTFRYVEDDNVIFKEGITHDPFLDEKYDETFTISDAQDIDKAIRKIIEQEADSNTAILLSSGMDSAILASYLKPGTRAYTFQCVAPDAIDETPLAIKYAKKYKLDHQIIKITWDDYLDLLPILMKTQGAPIHSIGPQILKAIKIAEKENITKLLSGYGADCLFGGLTRILAKERTLDEFINFYTFVEPQKVLKEPVSLRHVFKRFLKPDGYIDTLKYIHDGILGIEGATSFNAPFALTNIKNFKIYTRMQLQNPLDIQRIRNGEPKYMLAELFKQRYPGMAIPDKIALPRAVTQWLQNWEGPTREEFCVQDINAFSGEQKWLIFCLEQFLNMID